MILKILNCLLGTRQIEYISYDLLFQLLNKEGRIRLHRVYYAQNLPPQNDH